jgi:transposase
MRKTAFTAEQIAYALRQAESGMPVLEVCRKLGISEQTFYRWKKRFAGMGVAELRRLRQLDRGEPSAQAARRRPDAGQAHAARRVLRKKL